MEKPSHIKFVCRTFSDDEITELLDAGGNFRDLMPGWRDNILSQMRAGRWDTGNGECLAIDEDGNLANGQHRLSAAQLYQRETGEKVWFWVATGVRKGSDRSMDQGMSRTLGTMLRKEGVINASECAGIAISDARMAMSGKNPSLSCMLGGSTGKVSIPASYESWKRASASISKWASISKQLVKAGLPRCLVLASVGFQLAKKHPMDAELFFSYLKDGAGLESGDPILLLRSRLLEDRRSASSKMPQASVAAIVVKAWVAWKSGTPIKTLRYVPFGPAAEKFPSHAVD